MTPWEFKAESVSNCNCDYGCPCQFNSYPSKGHCDAVVCMKISEGHYGDTDLAGVRFGAVVSWPGAIHEGNGQCQPFIDESATPAQREAILKIMSGEDTDPMATVFAVFATTFAKVHDPIFTPIELEISVDDCTGRFRIPNLAEGSARPIRNPVTGEPHRARINLPTGFEYDVAEVGSGSTRAEGAIKLDLNDSHAHLAHMHMNNHGVVRHRAA
ncbi:DUF1326 domain-containing protein [Stappia sp. GBMRC 2046]|uniref:DUF1326 domain-containing protein n=1 Tax=Stappia sediminis TaxID=2692190 RepID=A0A7X3LYI3_9HYPH|nr:DUF1326 domain-containing protein [Stappia sediminis]MXN67371.1 DUF1326 domain-containing protein [Stappia sediminis]